MREYLERTFILKVDAPIEPGLIKPRLLFFGKVWTNGEGEYLLGHLIELSQPQWNNPPGSGTSEIRTHSPKSVCTERLRPLH